MKKLARDRVLSVVVAAGVIVGAANLGAYAANGKPLLLGQKNTETKTAVVVNKGSGPALSLKTKASAPPLAVSSTKKVARLNADTVDGVGAADLRTRAWVTRIPAGTANTHFSVALDVPAGAYVAAYTVNIVSVGGVECSIMSAGKHVGYANGVARTNRPTSVTGTGFVNVSTANSASLHCWGETPPMGISVNDPSFVTLTRVDQAVVRTTPIVP